MKIGTAEMRLEMGEFLEQLRTIRALSEKTISAYSFDLLKFSAFADRKIGEDWEIKDIDPYIVKAYIQYMVDRGNAPITRGRRLATLKSFFKYMLSQGKIKSDPVSQIRMPKRRDGEPSYLSKEEYRRLLKAVKKNATRYFKERDMAMVTMLLGMGLRLSELVDLNVGNIDFDNSSIKITRKGGAERILPASNDVIIAIQRYLKTREDVSPQAPLFLSKRGRRISNASVWHLVGKYMHQAQIEKNKLSPHTLRHTFATLLLKQGENILTIKQLLSHRSLRTTERYLHVSNEDLKDAVGKISLTP